MVTGGIVLAPAAAFVDAFRTTGLAIGGGLVTVLVEERLVLEIRGVDVEGEGGTEECSLSDSEPGSTEVKEPRSESDVLLLFPAKKEGRGGAKGEEGRGG